MITAKDNIIYGGPENECPTKTYQTVAHFALEQFKRNADKGILIDGRTGIEYTGNDLCNHVIRLAHCLKNLNINEGDVIGLSSENRIEFVVTVFAAFCLNSTVTLCNITYTERELDHVLKLSKPKIIFSSEISLKKIVNVAKKNTDFIQRIFVFSDSVDLPKQFGKRVALYSDLLYDQSFKSELNIEFKKTNINENVGLIACSSGTTGLPKGVQLTQKNIMYTIDRQFDMKAILEESTVLSVIPWFHNYGCMTMLMMSVIGGRLVFLPKFEENLFLNCIQKYKVNLAFVVPPLMVFLAKSPLINKYDLSSLKLLICGAAPLSKEIENTVKQRIGVFFVRQGYGLSESTLSLLVQTEQYCKPGSVGVLKPGTYAKVIDTETGKSLGPYERGELLFKGDCIMKGYIGDKKATESTIDKDGWLHTGDIGYYDSDFEFYIVDRIKELIKYKGFQVPPAEIEALLLAHPKIKDAAVIGVPNEECGELPMAFVVKQDKVDLTEQEVVDFIAERASPAKKLRGGVKFIKEIPKNQSGKILRRILRDSIKNSVKSKL